MGRNARLAARTVGSATPSQRLFLSLMFVIVAVKTEQFPVAAIRGVVVVVVIAVVNREFVQILAVELTRATPANPRVKLQRLLAIIAFALFPAPPGGGDRLIQFAGGG